MDDKFAIGTEHWTTGTHPRRVRVVATEGDCYRVSDTTSGVEITCSALFLMGDGLYAEAGLRLNAEADRRNAEAEAAGSNIRWEISDDQMLNPWVKNS